MYTTPKPPKPTSKQRDEKVQAVLAHATESLSPTRIAELINEPWCCPYGPTSAPISPVCKRIGAVNHGGKWSLK